MRSTATRTGPTRTAPTPEVHATTLLTGDAQAFAEKVWATRMHVHRVQPDEVTGLLSLADVDRMITSSAIRTPSIRLARDGRVLPTSCFTTKASLAGRPLTGLVDVRTLLEHFDDGTTVVLQGLQRSWPPVTTLAAQLERELGHPVQANAYLTPPGSQGFAVHADSHDVFVIQTHGTKTWQVHADDGVRDILMEPGTCMYLPTGTRHAASAMDTASLHVTIGIRQVTWRHVLNRAITAVLDDLSDDLDVHLPAGWLDDPASLAVALELHLHHVAAELADRDPAMVVDTEAERFLTTRPPPLGGSLVDRLVADDIDDTTVVARRVGHVVELRPDGDRLRILLGDRELTVPGWVRPAVEHVAQVAELRPGDLAEWLDPESRRVLVRRLVLEGLLRVLP